MIFKLPLSRPKLFRNQFYIKRSCNLKVSISKPLTSKGKLLGGEIE